MNIKKIIAVTILTTSFLISGISNPIGYNVSAFRPREVNASSIKTSELLMKKCEKTWSSQIVEHKGFKDLGNKTASKL